MSSRLKLFQVGPSSSANHNLSMLLPLSPRPAIVATPRYGRSARLFLLSQTVYLPAQPAIFPKLGLTQICIPKDMSSGRMPIVWSVLSQATGRQELSALIDGSDCFDAKAAESAGVDLSRLLWIRCGKKRKWSPTDRLKRPEFLGGGGAVSKSPKKPLKPLEQAFKTADILIQNGGLGLIVIDLGEIEEDLVRKIPLTTWFRFARVIEKQPTALIVFATYPAAQSCAALTLHIKNPEMHWNTETNSEALAHSNQNIHDGLCLANAQVRGDAKQQAVETTYQPDHNEITHAQLFSGLTYEVEVGRVRGQWRKPAQPSDIDLWHSKHAVKTEVNHKGAQRGVQSKAKKKAEQSNFHSRS